MIKRVMDVACASIGLILFLPVLLVVALIVMLDVGWPVLLRQERLGLKGRRFTIVKFRTMTDSLDGRGRLLPDSQRVTRVGNLLRHLSVDELPQFFNVLMGDMSMIGPRPLFAHYGNRYTPEQNRRHDVRPGITGLAQVYGRNGISWARRFELDVWYVDNWSALLDLKIALLTIPAVLGMKGVSQNGHATIAEFQSVDEPSTDFDSAVRAMTELAGGNSARLEEIC